MSEGDAMVDAELVLKFKGGEESAFEALVRKYMKDAYSFCLKLTHDAQEAEELSQMGFVNAYRALRGFRGESSFKSWLYRIFINQYRDHLRRNRRAEHRLEAVREEARHRSPVNLEESELHAGELADVVKEKVELLPDRQREVLVLHVYQGLGYGEIAASLGCTYDDVKMNLSLARKRLMMELKAYL
ncbi:MAG TPA: sigma-70 family RNA polymerase sigma factor [Planctomycetota bacterium]|jgi:RNA polymerase sigma-70 factor (ECF subfamily)|nr:sigma-70 family RNA polymerase sigma factor [Planctomycetota bacterium]